MKKAILSLFVLLALLCVVSAVARSGSGGSVGESLVEKSDLAGGGVDVTVRVEASVIPDVSDNTGKKSGGGVGSGDSASFGEYDLAQESTCEKDLQSEDKSTSSSPVTDSTLVLRPNAAGEPTGTWIPIGDAPNWKCVDDVVADDNNTYVYYDFEPPYDHADMYNLPDHTTQTGIIHDISVFARVRSPYNTPGWERTYAIMIKSWGTLAQIVPWFLHEDGTTWTTFSRTRARNPVTQQCWTWDDIDNLQIGIWTCSNLAYCTQVYCEVHWVPHLRGDANGDGVIDIGDVIYLINYLFLGTSPPEPLEVGDANCDGVVDIGDVIYLINYLFLSASPPGC